MGKVFIITALAACAAAAPQGYAVAHPTAAIGDLAEPALYAFNYGVSDDYSGNSFTQQEQRDGYATSGSYTVALPDGRIQTVKYTDNGDGIIQDVSYEGVPQYGPAVVVHAPVAHHAVVAHPVSHHAVLGHHALVAHPVAHALLTQSSMVKKIVLPL